MRGFGPPNDDIWIATISGLTAAWMITLAPAMAQQPEPAQIKLLSPAECPMIVKRPATGDYMVNGTITIGGMTFSNGNIPPNGIRLQGADPFDVITRSCFAGKGT
jgi:hypothetical protein